MTHIYKDKSGEYIESDGYNRKQLDEDKSKSLVTDPAEVTKARKAIKEAKAKAAE